MTNFLISRRRVLLAGMMGVAGGVVLAGEAMAQNKTIPGIGIRVKKSPGGNKRIKPTKTGADGGFRFTGLEPGNYEVTIGDAPPQMVTVGKDGVLAGTVFGQKNAAGQMEYSYKPQKEDGSPPSI
jgi:hypothetical protein